MIIKRYRIRDKIKHVLAAEIESKDNEMDDEGYLIEPGRFKVRVGPGQILYFEPFTFNELFEKDEKVIK